MNEKRAFPANTKHLYNMCTTPAQRLRPALYKCYTNVLCLLDRLTCGIVDQLREGDKSHVMIYKLSPLHQEQGVDVMR